MNTAVSVSPATQAAIDACKQNLRMCQGRLLATFSAVPDDKLTFSPSPTSKGALQLVAHCANSNYSFIGIIRQQMNSGDREQRMAELKAKEEAVKTRAEATEQLNTSVEAVCEALDSLNDETIGVDVPTPFMTAPMMFWMYLPARHIDNHAAQIDYIQTIWGDMEWHFK